MDSLLSSLFLGIIQGLSEFLPISSSGHLVISPWLFNFIDPGLSFDVALHVGTLVAVLSYFFRDWVEITKAFFSRTSSLVFTEYTSRFAWLIMLGTLPGVLVGFFLEDLAEHALRSPLLIAGTLFFGGALLYFVDRFCSATKNLTEMNARRSLLVGLAQALALVPGVSRSGITMTLARGLGFDRVSSARFSFLLSTPIIFGAAILKFPEIVAQAGMPSFWVGVSASAISGYLAIKYLLRFLARYGFALFFWYRTLLAVLILFFYFSRH